MQRAPSGLRRHSGEQPRFAHRFFTGHVVASPPFINRRINTCTSTVYSLSLGAVRSLGTPALRPRSHNDPLRIPKVRQAEAVLAENFWGRWPIEGVDCQAPESTTAQLCHNNVNSRSPRVLIQSFNSKRRPSYRIKTLQRDYPYRWQNCRLGEN